MNKLEAYHSKVWRHGRERGCPYSVGRLRSSNCFSNCRGFTCLCWMENVHHAHRHSENNLAGVKRMEFFCQYQFSVAGRGPGRGAPVAQESCSRRSRGALAWSLGCCLCNCCRPLPMVSHLQHPPSFSRAGGWTPAKCFDRPGCQPCV